MKEVNLLKLLIISVVMASFYSCATIYTGNKYLPIDKSKLNKIDRTVTFRFLTINKYKNFKTNKDNWFVLMNGSDFNPDCEHIKSLNLFKEVACLATKDGKAMRVHYDSYEEFEKGNSIKFDTDYFIDIKIQRPFYYHGSGTGMYGLLMSAITLGIIPSYWTYEGEYQIDIRSKKEERSIDKIQYSENYGSLSSSLFWILPSSEFESLDLRKNKMEKKRIENYLEKILSKLRSEIVSK